MEELIKRGIRVAGNLALLLFLIWIAEKMFVAVVRAGLEVIGVFR
jgi:hypothetical protein